MTEPRPGRPHGRPPTVPAPRPFVERRATFRRAADRLAHRETVLLARSLDVLVDGGSAEDRLVRILRLLATTVRARRAAVLADDGERRIVVDGGTGDPHVAERLAAWLDAEAPRSRAARAATGRAPVTIIGADAEPGGSTRVDATAEGSAGSYACLPVPAAGDVALGFEFAAPIDDDELARRLPAQLARHAAVVLSLVTRQLAVESELDDLRAREAERARFVSTVAHELRTPLTGLSGYLDLMLDGKVDDPAVERDFLERGRSIADSMAELVGDLLELSRLESGSLRFAIGPFSVAEVGMRAVEGLESVALRRGIHLSTNLPPRLRAATGDRRRVEQILTNLVGNALKFATAGSHVEVGGWFDGPVALLAVRDEGAGISPDDRGRIFERFYRMGGHERITGTGLGLPIARELARCMGGDLDVASVAGSGSSFVLALPGPTAQDPEPIAAALARALAAEEVRLEEAAVLRALHDAGRSLPEPRAIAAPPADGAVPAARGGATAGRTRPARLRALDGLGGRTVDPATA